MSSFLCNTDPTNSSAHQKQLLMMKVFTTCIAAVVCCFTMFRCSCHASFFMQLCTELPTTGSIMITMQCYNNSQYTVSRGKGTQVRKCIPIKLAAPARSMSARCSCSLIEHPVHELHPAGMNLRLKDLRTQPQECKRTHGWKQVLIICYGTRP